MKKMNKTGTNKILSIYWFVILIIVAGGVFAMIYIFYGPSFDVRELEASILADKIADCLSEGGRINLDLLNQGSFNEDFKNSFLSECTLNFDDEYWKEEQYYVEINFYKPDNLKKSIFNISKGNVKCKANCKLQEEKKYEKLPVCIEKRFYSLDEKNVQYLIKILSVVRKTEKNVE